MSAASDLKAINCTSCGGSLSVLGGHKVKTVTCGYCGALMDRHDGLKVLEQYRNMRRPYGPLKLGVTGTLRGVEHTVIGIVGMETEDWDETYRWTDYQLYSPTHGYSWLTWNDGHAIHSRKLRGDLPTMTGRIRAEKFETAGQTFRFFERHTAKITYLEGELTWQARLGDETRVNEAIAPPFGLATAGSDAEIEHELQTYIDSDEFASAFSLDGGPPLPGGIHPIQPFKAPIHREIARIAGVFVALCAAITLYLANNSDGTVVATGETAVETGTLSLQFDTPRADTLTHFDIAPTVRHDQAAYFNVVLTNTDSSWSKDFRLQVSKYGRGHKIATRLPEAGKHEMNVEHTPYYKDDPIGPPVRITVLQGAKSASPLFWLTFAFVLIGLSYFARRTWFSMKRWKA